MDLKKQMLNYLDKQGSGSTKDIAAKIGITADKAGKLLNELTKAGLIEKTEKKSGAIKMITWLKKAEKLELKPVAKAAKVSEPKKRGAPKGPRNKIPASGEDQVLLIDYTDEQFKNLMSKINVDMFARVLTYPKGPRSRCDSIVDRMQALKLLRCPRFKKSEVEVWFKLNGTPATFHAWVKTII
jgi:DNA-binding Lrp family transcriptional regulator